MAKRVMVMPCSGIGKPTGEIGRQAAYAVTRQLRPDRAEMACLARLVIGDPETIAAVNDYFVITLDGCPDDCARKNVERLGKTVDFPLHVADLLEQHSDLHPAGILNIGADGFALVDLLAEQVAEKVDELTSKEE